MEKHHEERGEGGQKQDGAETRVETPPQVVRIDSERACMPPVAAGFRQRLHARTTSCVCHRDDGWPQTRPRRLQASRTPASAACDARQQPLCTLPRSPSSARPPYGHAYRRNCTLHVGTQSPPAGARTPQRGCAGRAHTQLQPSARACACVRFSRSPRLPNTIGAARTHSLDCAGINLAVCALLALLGGHFRPGARRALPFLPLLCRPSWVLQNIFFFRTLEHFFCTGAKATNNCAKSAFFHAACSKCSP
jgi:hypothetical protein